ncbi:MAG TPA: hypothetical protein VGB91_12155 [Rhizomicrobium sp.]
MPRSWTKFCSRSNQNGAPRLTDPAVMTQPSSQTRKWSPHCAPSQIGWNWNCDSEAVN